MKPAAELIVDPAGRHLVERVGDDVQGLLIPIAMPSVGQQPQVHRMRKLRCRAEPAVYVVERSHGGRRRAEHQRRLQFALPHRPGGDRPQLFGQRIGLLDGLLAAVLPGVGHGREHLVEARHAHPGRSAASRCRRRTVSSRA